MGESGAGKSRCFAASTRSCLRSRRPLQRRDRARHAGASSAPRSAASRGGWRWCFQDFEAQLFSTNVRLEVAFGPASSACRPTRSPPASSARWHSSTWRRSGARSSTLSGGQKQRLAIASILAMEPAVLLLDEPATDLDPIGRRELYAALEGVRGTDLVLLAVEHEIEPVMRADRLILMKGGRIVADGPVATVAPTSTSSSPAASAPRSRRARTPSRPRAAARRRRCGCDAPRAGSRRRCPRGRGIGHAPPCRRAHPRSARARARLRGRCTRLPT
jgi:energy-coupling factor transporter ATP-binding protein EcfA2